MVQRSEPRKARRSQIFVGILKYTIAGVAHRNTFGVCWDMQPFG